MRTNLADIRQEYTKSGLRENELPGDPLSLFSRWLQEAIDAEVDEPTVCTTASYIPCNRMANGKSVVLLPDFVDFSWQLQLEYVILQL